MLNKPDNFAIFDGHNDLLTRLWLSHHPDPIAEFFEGRATGHLDLARCLQSGFRGGLFAIFLPPFSYIKQHHPEKLSHPHLDDFSEDEVEKICLEQLEIAKALVLRSNDQLQLCTSFSEIQQSLDQQKISVVLHLEGAECLQQHPDLLDHFYQHGLRSIGPLWNRPSAFGHGLNSPFPHAPQIRNPQRGLTSAGKTLIHRCEQKKMLIDVSHMNEDAFWDTAELIQQPLIATHSNVHTLSHQARNLTDQQLYAIRDSNGMVGLNFDVAFLRADGQRNTNTSIDTMLNHIEYLIEKMGEQHVGFGSDFDGCLLSDEVKDVTGLLKIIEKMQQRNYSTELIEQICNKNWINTLKRIWG